MEILNTIEENCPKCGQSPLQVKITQIYELGNDGNTKISDGVLFIECPNCEKDILPTLINQKNRTKKELCRQCSKFNILLRINGSLQKFYCPCCLAIHCHLPNGQISLTGKKYPSPSSSLWSTLRKRQTKQRLFK